MPAFRWYEKETGQHDGLQSRQGRGRARAAPLRRRRPAGGGWRQPRKHVLRRRSSLLGDDERVCATGSAPARGSTSPTSPIPMGSPARSPSTSGTCCSSSGRRAASGGGARSTSTAVAPIRSCGARSPWSCATSTSPPCSATSSRASRSSTPPSSATTRSRTTPGSNSPTRSRCSSSTTLSLPGWSARSRSAPRPYHLVVLSDHGQSQGRPFRQRYGLELEELVEGALGDGDVYAPPAPDEGMSSRWRRADRRAGRGHGGRQDACSRYPRPPRRRRGRPRAQPRGGRGVAPDASKHAAVVLASGGLGLISLPQREHRMSVGEIESLHPRLIETLVDHPGIGFVMVRADDGGRVVLGAKGTRRLDDDAGHRRGPAARLRAQCRRPPPAHRRLPALPRHPREVHVRPGGQRGRPVRGVHGLPRGARGLAEPPLCAGAGRAGASRRRRSSACGRCTTRSGAGWPRRASI